MKGKIAAVGAIAAGAAVWAGSMLDWSGVGYSSDSQRLVVYGAGLATILVGIAALWRRRAIALAAIPGAVALDLGLVNARDVNAQLHEYAAYPHASVGTGLVLVLIGATVAVACALTALVPTATADPRPRPQ